MLIKDNIVYFTDEESAKIGGAFKKVVVDGEVIIINDYYRTTAAEMPNLINNPSKVNEWKKNVLEVCVKDGANFDVFRPFISDDEFVSLIGRIIFCNMRRAKCIMRLPQDLQQKVFDGLDMHVRKLAIQSAPELKDFVNMDECVRSLILNMPTGIPYLNSHVIENVSKLSDHSLLDLMNEFRFNTSPKVIAEIEARKIYSDYVSVYHNLRSSQFSPQYLAAWKAHLCL